MNIDKSAPPVTQETATAALIVAETRSNVVRALDAEEILLVAGGPETDVSNGAIG